MNLKLKSRGWVFRLANAASWLLTPGFSQCGCCGGYWNVVESHTTTYSQTTQLATVTIDGKEAGFTPVGFSMGCFPLCEVCWERLGTPTARLPYYRALYEDWHAPEEKWEVIQLAVLAGG